MRAPFIIPATAALFALVGCSPAAPARDKAFYAAHPADRARAVAACEGNPGTFSGTPDCANAIAADADAEHVRVFHGPPPKAVGVNNSSHL